MIDIKLYEAMFNDNRSARSTYTNSSNYQRTHATYVTSDSKEFHLHYWGELNAFPRPATITLTCEEFIWSRRVYIHTFARSMGFLMTFADILEDDPNKVMALKDQQEDITNAIKLQMANGEINVSEILNEDWSIVINDGYEPEDVEAIMVRLILENISKIAA